MKKIIMAAAITLGLLISSAGGQAMAWCDCIKTPSTGGGTKIHLHYSTAINRAYADHWSGTNGTKSAVASCLKPGTSQTQIQADATPDGYLSQSYRTCSGSFTQLLDNGYYFYA